MIEQPETCDDCGEFTYDCKCENARLRKENTQLTATIASQRAEIKRLRGEVERKDAEVFLLTDAMHQAQHTVQFLHGCLTDQSCRYAYPEQTMGNLKEWAKLAPLPPSCIHSFSKAGCESCIDRNERQQKRIAALAALTPKEQTNAAE